MQLLNDVYKKALLARENAYAPYSGLKVGAAILSDNESIYAGGNVENSSYPCGTCAEAGAIAAMITAGERKIKKIVIVAEKDELIVPCGACLQRILEFSDDQTTIYLANLKEIRRSYKLSELLPVSFRADELKK